MKATIFDIQRNSYVDGPGIRTTVFFKGCNLRCAWCHNPESRNFQKEILFYKNKCTECGRCKDLTVDNTDFFCFQDAKKICGKEYNIDEVFDEIIKDKAFYEASGGGVTCSGGECMLQLDFLLEFLKQCKENGIHTAVDTAGNVSWNAFETILPYTDLFLYDVKTMDSAKHQKYTGVDNTLIHFNLAKLLKSNTKIWVRIPVISGINDTEAEFRSLQQFFREHGFPEKIECLPYHAMGEHKYTALSKTVTRFESPSEEQLQTLRQILSKEKQS